MNENVPLCDAQSSQEINPLLEQSHRFETELNAAQLEAVQYCDGPSLVIAGAGSGKTRVLTYKIAYLLEQGYRPWEILALTFTNKAAREMVNRIAMLINSNKTLVQQGTVRELWAGTFHSIFARILRIESSSIGFDPNFTIYDTVDTRALIKTIVKEMGLEEKTYKPTTIAGRISDAKNRLILPDSYQRNKELRQRDERDKIGATGQIYATYVQRCRQANAMDFDDLLLHTFMLLDGDESVRRKYQQRFRYILVDEYQDTNYVQYRIIRLLAPAEARLCVVGDDAQSIYAFRGADIGNILSFKDDYPTMRLIKLEQNYRSTQTIVNAANSIISHNAGRIPKVSYSKNSEGEKLQLLTAISDREESMKVLRKIQELVRRKSLSYEQIAILYRTNAQSRAFEESLRTVNIPYRIYGSLSFYQRKEVKDCIAYFRLTVNPRDEEALLRIINYPVRGIGQTTVSKLQIAAVQADAPLWDVLCRPQNYGLEFNKGTQQKLAAFVMLVNSFRERQTEQSAYELALDIIKRSGISADVTQDTSAENLARRENVEELLNSVREYERDSLEEEGRELTLLSDYLPRVALLTDQDQRDTEQSSITLMTVHAAKGLEYRAVFVTGLEQDLFPNANARYNPRELEEERRLFYVAVTRAKEYCFLSYAKQRYKYGQMEFCEPSRFIEEVDKDCLEKEPLPKAATETFRYSSRRNNVSHAAFQAEVPSGRQWKRVERSPFAPMTSSATVEKSGQVVLAKGQRIEHERFGIGIVQSVEGEGMSAKAQVMFEHAGVKNLLLKFARFRILE